jgi:hypothetical protein
MIDANSLTIRNQRRTSAVLLALGLYAAWMIGGWIATENLASLEFSVVGVVACAICVAILQNWRSGFYAFLVWLLFEDLIRKFLGNNMWIFFAKDMIVGITYISFLFMIRRKQVAVFRPPFLIWFGVFFWLAVIQVFNPNSPSIFYGLLGLKIYFYYFGLIFVGYALIRNDEDLHRFLVINMILAAVIAGLGIVQAIVGPGFLNPGTLAPEIRELGSLTRYAPISGARVFRPSSVFVSDGRFASYMLLMWIFGLGASGSLFLRHSHRGQTVILGGTGLVAVAIAFSGSRGAIIEGLASFLVLAAAFLWSAPLTSVQSRRLARGARRACFVVAIGLVIAITLYPSEIGARWSFYSETLSPFSSASELVGRGGYYPTEGLLMALTQPNWILGNGIGTASLGVQYVNMYLKQPRPEIGVESGWGNLLLQLGIPGLVLWLIWTARAVISSWKVAMDLRITNYAPVAFSIAWFVLLLLVLTSYHTLDAYENYVYNAYLWILFGVLFSLPRLAIRSEAPAIRA